MSIELNNGTIFLKITFKIKDLAWKVSNRSREITIRVLVRIEYKCANSFLWRVHVLQTLSRICKTTSTVTPWKKYYQRYHVFLVNLSYAYPLLLSERKLKSYFTSSFLMGFALFNVVVKIKLLGSNEMISLESTTIVIWKTICYITISSDNSMTVY